jgi:hypothetical protein
MSLGTNVTVDQLFSGCSMWVEMSLGHSVGGRSVKVPHLAYQRQDVFLHNLMKPVLAHKEIGEKNYRALEEYLDLLIRTLDIAEEARMLPVVLHRNNLRSMYEKWPHGEQAKWWTHAERSDIMQQPLEFRLYIMERYRVVATLASSMVIASTSRSSNPKDSDKKKDGQGKQGGGGKPPQKANVSAITQQQQQQPAGPPQQPPMQCRLGSSGCQEAHPLEKCEHFKRLSPKQRVVKANELHLCLICLRHKADRECYARGNPDYKGCSESGRGMEHHPLLHWALIVARLFQVQVAAETYPPGTQVFQLRQRVKMGKTEVGLAFDGDSNLSVITNEYATRKKLKKVGFTIPVIGFGSPEPEMGCTKFP